MEINIPAIRQPDESLPVKIRDLESRMPEKHPYRSSAMVTWAHETTHGLNSRIRNQRRDPKVNAFYLYDGVALLATEPRVRISDFADSIPRNLRGNIYKLYLITQQRWWNDRPLYLFDEWVAYQNGSLLALDIGDRSRDDSLFSCLQMANYCAHMMALESRDTTPIEIAEDTQEAFRRLLGRMVELFDGYRPVVSEVVRKRINSYLDNMMDSAAHRVFYRYGSYLTPLIL